MANYETLKATISDVVKENGYNEITGNLLQQQLLAMVNSLGIGYQYVGIATPATNPGTPDQNVFYIASTAGTYANFGGSVLADGEIAILKYNGAWSKDSTGAATQESVNQLGQKVGDVLLDLQNASVGKYLSDGSANTDSAYNHKEIDATSLRGKVIAYRLGYVLPPYAPFSSDSCYLRKMDNSIVSLSSYRVNADSDIYVVIIPNDASALLISWTVDARYTTNPFITYNYTTNIISNRLQNAVAEQALCKEIDINDYTIIDNSFIKTNGTIEEVPSIGISVIQMNVKKGDCLFVKGQSGATNGIVFTYNSGTGKYIPISPFELVQVGTDNFYVFFHYFNENTTIFINRWVNNTTKTSIALGNIYENTNTIYQDIKELISKLPADYGSYVKYIPIGDSITDGTGATPALGSYCKRLNEHFGFNFYYPLAQGGLSVVRQNGQYATYPLLKDKIASSQLNNFKGIISVSVGTNDYGNGHSPLGTFDQIKNVAYANLRPTPSEYDSTYTFAEGFRYDLETLKRNNPNATIIVLSPINRVGEDYEYIQGVNLQSYRDLEKQICELLGIVYVDMRHCGIAKWNTSPIWSADNLHPNDYGYYLMTSFLIPIFANLIESQYYLDTNLN